MEQEPTSAAQARRGELASWEQVRRYAVPRWMIALAAERRLAGDWRGACAAANVDVEFDLGEVASAYGAPVATALEEDLAHFAPDLARWHLPRWLRGYAILMPQRGVLLARYADADDGPALSLNTSQNDNKGAPRSEPQRLTLRFGRFYQHGPSDWRPGTGSRSVYRGRVDNWTTSRHLWDARRAGELRARCGGADRAPFCTPDGTPLAASELPAADPGPGDPAGRTEWAALLQERGAAEEAAAVAGIELDAASEADTEGGPITLVGYLQRRPLALTRLAAEVQLLTETGQGGQFYWHVRSGGSIAVAEPGPAGLRLRLRLTMSDQIPEGFPGAALLPDVCWRPLPDLDLVFSGRVTADQLHPLVSASLFPAREPDVDDGPPDGPLPAPVRLRCRGEWHEVSSAGGRLQIQHTPVEEQRERSLVALGGTTAGCFAVQRAWTSGEGWLPRGLRDQRRELFNRVLHGDTPGVLRLLDAGVDPRVRDVRRFTLLHVLHYLDWQVLLPRLLADGLDLEALDYQKRTPLHIARQKGPAGLISALVAAGARTDDWNWEDDD